MLRWVEVGLETNKDRYQTLSQFLTDSGVPNEVSYLDVTKENSIEKIKEAMLAYDGIKIGRGMGEITLELFSRQSVVMSRVKAADCLVKLNGDWWPQSAAYEGMSYLLAGIGEKLDLNSSALIVGSGAAARVACASLAKIGFSSFGISDQSPEKVQKFIEDLSHIHLGVSFKVILKEELILLPGNYGVLINTTPFEPGNEMLEELYYFNFLKPGGVAIDFIITPIETPLLKEAEGIGALTVKGYQLSAYADVIWAKWFCGVDLDPEEYAGRLKESLPKTT